MSTPRTITYHVLQSFVSRQLKKRPCSRSFPGPSRWIRTIISVPSVWTSRALGFLGDFLLRVTQLLPSNDADVKVDLTFFCTYGIKLVQK